MPTLTEEHRPLPGAYDRQDPRDFDFRPDEDEVRVFEARRGPASRPQRSCQRLARLDAALRQRRRRCRGLPGWRQAAARRNRRVHALGGRPAGRRSPAAGRGVRAGAHDEVRVDLAGQVEAGSGVGPGGCVPEVELNCLPGERRPVLWLRVDGVLEHAERDGGCPAQGRRG